MQTFLPYADFKESALILDSKRTWKQTVECMQILNTLCGKNSGWKNHPIMAMWKGCESALLEYTIAFLNESIARGINVSAATQEKIYDFADKVPSKINYPQWLGNKDFHLAHQSNLLRKDYKYYSVYFHNVPDDLPYLWLKS